MTDKTPTKFRDRDNFNTKQMEAALCAWEWMCENREHVSIAAHFGALGSVAMRHCSMQAGDIAMRVHDHMTAIRYEFVDAYDWRFVPAVLVRLDWKKLVADNQSSGEPYSPDVHAILLSMIAGDKAAHTAPNRYFRNLDERAA